ncbi:mycofactocin system transcriptional regulator [Aeromicrobium ginsengisoli]|uniref:Mycofactocin system transcriptional regulator n=1 Tax=Aeromicrobium ginsengisoli TaxID=363867 RepID=A0A5M4FAE2_9ACTN|nr:mycofactocin system transcriptional regulator [Aeromicrobium ginsengisoli]KAA1394209.1 mycofactocin system transcriptional regulator [Aeromicrobium ginsengisoli]
MSASRTKPQGRPSATDHAAIERAAFALFEAQGFDETTMEQIADAVGVGRRTLFRYFPSKNDIPWGQFDESLRHFREQFDAVPDDVPLAETVHRCVIAFNDFDEASMPQHRVRMRLILTTPALQAHSALRYEAWRAVISEYVGRRLSMPADAPLPRLVGHVSLALAVASYERWLAHPDTRLTEVFAESMVELRAYLTSG